MKKSELQNLADVKTENNGLYELNVIEMMKIRGGGDNETEPGKFK
jgi:hypothetical protein